LPLNLYGGYDLPPGRVPGLTLTGRVTDTSAQYHDRAKSQKIPDGATRDVGLRCAPTFRDRALTLPANVVNVSGKPTGRRPAGTSWARARRRRSCCRPRSTSDAVDPSAARCG